MISEFKKKKAMLDEIEIKNFRKVKCSQCDSVFENDTIALNNNVCTKCGHHFSMAPENRVELIFDKNTFEVIDIQIGNPNPIDFPDYLEKKKDISHKINAKEAAIAGFGLINRKRVATVIMDNRFILGSMGIYVGELIIETIMQAIEHKTPVVIFTTSGGARMQEGIHSLMQMAKIDAALNLLDDAGLPYITVITDPTYGGVTASFALQGDINIAEKGARLGFAGRRVIEQTIRKDLPNEFQTAEFNQQNGFIDHVVNRNELKELLSKVLSIFVQGGSDE
jgi:acetyl-CoA carboxylase carboxyl transferase subunit beta